MIYFFSISLNVNEQKGKLMHNWSINSFHKNDDFVTICFQRKEDCTTLLFSKKWGIATLSMKRLIICTYQPIDLSWMTIIQLSKEKTILRHFVSLKINRLKTNFDYRLIMTKKTLINPIKVGLAGLGDEKTIFIAKTSLIFNKQAIRRSLAKTQSKDGNLT